LITPQATIGRYALFDPIATGGMASVHLGRLLGPPGSGPAIAIKRLHAHLCRSPDFAAMFLDEAHLAARVKHPNVAVPFEIIEHEGELFLAMEYVHGVSLSHLLREARARGERLSPALAAAVIAGALRGLHAAHAACNEQGEPLSLVHRDVSPPNILVGVDGVTRVVDFGVAKASERQQTTREGELKGKLSYMSPEQLEGRETTARSDVFAASVCLWELLTGEKLFQGTSDADLVEQILVAPIRPPSCRRGELPAELDAVVLRGLARAAEDRFASAAEMCDALERAVSPLPCAQVGSAVRSLAAGILAAREELVGEIERGDFEPMAIRTDGQPRPSMQPARSRDEIDTVPSGIIAPHRPPPAPEPCDVPAPPARLADLAVVGASAGVLMLLGMLAASYALDAGPGAPDASSLIPAAASSASSASPASPARRP
jgi:eukaryotic-like serine/threonine-protein kinase